MQKNFAIAKIRQKGRKEGNKEGRKGRKKFWSSLSSENASAPPPANFLVEGMVVFGTEGKGLSTA